MKRRVEVVEFGDGVVGRVYRIEGIMPSPFCSPWRHPIWRWRLRHLRKDIRVLDKVNPDFTTRLRELEDEVFLYGTGSA